MKNLFFKTIVLSSMVLTSISCEKDGISQSNEDAASSKQIALTEEQLSAVRALGLTPDGNTATEIKGDNLFLKENGIIVEDIILPYSKLNSVIAKMSNIGISKNGRLDIDLERVSFPEIGKRKIKVAINTSTEANNLGLTPKQVNAAISAVQRFQALNMKKLDFEFILANGPQEIFLIPGGVDISILAPTDDQLINVFGVNIPDVNDPTGNCPRVLPIGVALSPRNGNPGEVIFLTERTINLEQETITTTLQHELGHTLGFLHSDHLTRRSCEGLDCVPSGGENIDPSTYEQVPGNGSSGDNINSIMTACSGNIDNTTFTSSDIISFRNAYSGDF